LYVDGSSSPKGVGAHIMLEGPNRIFMKKSLVFAFRTSKKSRQSMKPSEPNYYWPEKSRH